MKSSALTLDTITRKQQSRMKTLDLTYIFIHLEVIKSSKLLLQKEFCNNYWFMIDAKD